MLGHALAELALWAASSDEIIERHELNAIVSTVRQLPGLDDFSLDDVRDLARAMAVFQSESAVETRVKTLAQLLSASDLRTAAFELAVYCTASDGILSADEMEFLSVLQHHLEIDSSDAAQLIVEVTR